MHLIAMTKTFRRHEKSVTRAGEQGVGRPVRELKDQGLTGGRGLQVSPYFIREIKP